MSQARTADSPLPPCGRPVHANRRHGRSLYSPSDHQALARWERDSFKFPPYHYLWQNGVTNAKTWRCPDANEREGLLAFRPEEDARLCLSVTAVHSGVLACLFSVFFRSHQVPTAHQPVVTLVNNFSLASDEIIANPGVDIYQGNASTGKGREGTPQRHMETPFACNPSILSHVRARRRGHYVGGKNIPFATEAGRISSKPLAENFAPASNRQQLTFVCSSIELDIGRFLVRPMRGGVLSLTDFGNTTFLGYLCRVRVAKTLQVLSLSALSKLAIDLRVPSAFLFRGKPDEQTIVNLHLCCFGSRTFSHCSLVSPLNITSVVTGDTGSAVFVLDKTFGNWACFEDQKTRSSVAIPAFSRFCPHDGRMNSALPTHPWHTATP